MKKTAVAVLLLLSGAGVALAQSTPQREVLVLTTATTITSGINSRRAIEIQNLGPNPIFCSLGTVAPVLNKSRRIDANGGTWSIVLASTVNVVCIATANQVTGAATIVSEAK